MRYWRQLQLWFASYTQEIGVEKYRKRFSWQTDESFGKRVLCKAQKEQSQNRSAFISNPFYISQVIFTSDTHKGETYTHWFFLALPLVSSINKLTMILAWFKEIETLINRIQVLLDALLSWTIRGSIPLAATNLVLVN